MSYYDKCGHGKTYKEECLDCEAISLQETIRSFEPIVDKAKKKLAEVERHIAERDRAAHGDKT